MKGDFSRQTFDPARHFSTVRLQQGRVQLDADFNEQVDLVLHRERSEAADVIGACGGPLGAAAFGVVLDLAEGDFTLTPGRYYVDGILCENEAPVPYTNQPDRPPLDPLDSSQAGFSVVYLDVWDRHLTWLDDPALRETALGGPDTATRTRTVWQVRTVFAGTAKTTCADDPAAYLAAIAPSTGRLGARARREAATPDPCLVPATAGYTGLENQLYRVEIHAPGEPYDLTSAPGDHPVTVTAADKVVYAAGTWSVGQAVEIFRSAPGSEPMEGALATIAAHAPATKTLTLDVSLPDLGPGDAPRIRPVGATYKWSRDNGSVVTGVSAVAGRDVVVGSLGPDDVLGFAPGQWVELSDELTELESAPGFLAQIAEVDRDARTVTLRSDPPAFAGSVLKLRRWDGAGALKIDPPGAAEPFAELENGVQVGFKAGEYHTGDHWLIPARTATADAQSGTIEWPAEGGQPALLPPAGILHHFCKLAVLRSDGSAFAVQDCRGLFPPVTELATLLYVGGDGQEARPGEPLPQLLEAGVFRGRHPVEGAAVRFKTGADGALAADIAALPSGAQTSFETVTGADGVAACAWRPAGDLGRPSQRVEARLLDSGGAPLASPLHFNAELSLAAEVAYVPGACADLAGAATVQEALDVLCARPSGGEACCRVVRPGTPLEQAVNELTGRGERDICLCLQAGEHKLGQLVLGVKEADTLVIESCGDGARVLVTAAVEFHSLQAVTLRNVDLLLLTDQPLLFDGCAEVTIDGCRITQQKVVGPVAVVGSAERVHVRASVLDGRLGIGDDHPRELVGGVIGIRDPREFEAKATAFATELAGASAGTRKELAGTISRAQRIRRLSANEQRAWALLPAILTDDKPAAPTIVAALAKLQEAAAFGAGEAALVLLDARAEALIESTDLIGALGLYGIPGKELDESALPALRDAQKDERLTLRGLGSLHLHDVRLTAITLGEDVVARLSALPKEGKLAQPAFRAVHAADTEVLDAGTLLMAGDVTFTALDFAESGRDVGAVIADSAVVTATRAPGDVRLFVLANGLATAGNMRINVVQL